MSGFWAGGQKKESETEYDTIHDNPDVIKKEDEAYNMQRSNVRTDMGIKLITDNFTIISMYFDTILQSLDVYFKEHGPKSMGMIIEKNDFNHMEMLNKNIKEMMEQVKTKEFLSPENLDAYHREMMEKENQEKLNALNSLKAIEATNAKKVIPKIINYINTAMGHFQKADIDMSGLKWFNSIGQNQVLNPLNETLDFLNHMQDKVEAIKRREK